MSESVVKANERQSLNGMPTVSEASPEAEESTEVLLAMLFTAAKLLERRGVLAVLTGVTPISKKPVTYIRMPMVEVDNVIGFKVIANGS